MFASFREACGTSEKVCEVAPGTTVEQLWEQWVNEHPKLRPLSAGSAFAVNGRYAVAGTPLSEGDVVAFLPPVSGG